MTSTIENTFGSKLRNAQDLISYLKGFTGYNPLRSQESVAEMSTLVENIVAANNTLATSRQQFKAVVSDRQKAYRGSPGSIEKILSPLKGAIDAQYGKTSTESKSITRLIKTMRATKLIKLPADPTKGTQEKTISQSERSFGSIVQSYNNIISSLQQFAGFNPSNTSLKVEALQAAANKITELNNTVAQNIHSLKTTQTSRNMQYDDLKDRVQRIKAYVKSQYGIASTEYNLVKGIKV